MKHSRWSGKTDGLPWMQRALIHMFHWLDIRILYVIMSGVVPFYMLFNHQGYASIYSFFRNRLGYSPLKSFFYVYLNHFVFGQIILDRFAAYAGRKFSFDIENQELFSHLASCEEGFIQLSSHVGNYELAGYSLVAKEKRFNILVFSGETETVMRNRERMLSGNNMRMVSMAPDFSHIFILNNALMNGEIVSIPGDRIFGSSKYVECLFFDRKARFPLGPFALAVQRGVNMLAVFVMKEAYNKYRVFVRSLPLNKQLAMRQEQMAHLAQSFATELEKVVRRYPTQWFNYYDFWLSK